MGNPKVTSGVITLKNQGGGVWGSKPAPVLIKKMIGPRPNAYPNVIQFRDVLQDSGQATQNITVTNHGDEAATLNSVAVDNTEFTLTLPTIPASIAPNASVVVGVNYNPTGSTGVTDSAVLTLSYDEAIDQRCQVYSNKITTAKAQVNISNTGATQFLDQDNTVYTLTEDITTPDIAFVAASQYSELNLNGFTVTYNTGGTDYSAGIYNAGDFAQTPPVRVGFTSEGCRGFHVYGNGSIVEGSTTSEYSHCIHFMQNNGRNGLLIEDVTLVPKGISSVGIGPQGFIQSIVRDIAIDSEVVEINDRHNLEGYLIRLIANTGNYGYLFENIQLTDGAQGGIACSGEDSHYVDVTSNHRELYTNGFGIHVGQADSARIYNSSVIPVSGRGIGIMENSSNIWAWNNTVDVVATIPPVNGETAEPGNAYALQFETTIDSWAWGNNLTARADVVDGYVVRTTNMTVPHYAYNNTLNAVRVGSTDKIAACYSGAVSQLLEGANNTCTTDQTYIYTDYDPFSDLSTYNDSLTTGSNPASVGVDKNDLWFATFNRRGGPLPSFNNKVVDLVTTIPLSQIFGQASATALYSLDESHTIQFKDNVGSVDYAVVDQQSDPSDSGQSDAGGTLVTYQALTQYYNDAVNAVASTPLGDHTYSATKAGFTPVNSSFTADQAKIIEITMEPV